MNKEKQRIAIAEACGLPKPYSMCFGKVPNTLCHSVMVTNGVKHGMPIPDYLTDLNAMHEVEKLLTEDQAEKFRAWLLKLNGYNHDRVVSCTAAQRAEAFLRTVGKWEDDK
jgi:hypothetical protein